ncbi:MAG: UDP-N-acetylmuramoylalanyl-D-glutamate--2,6-diaminopimelate ligase, partial [uncultured Sphingomonadaceae bacterium]
EIGGTDRRGRGRTGDGVRDRPPQGRARDGLRGLSRRAVQRGRLHPGRGAGGGGGGRCRPACEGRRRGADRRRRAAADLRAPRGQVLRAVSGSLRRGDGDQRQDEHGGALPAAVADGGASVGVGRDAGDHDGGRPDGDGADDTRCGDVPEQHGGPGAGRREPCGIRGIEPRAGSVPDGGRARAGGGVHQLQPRPSRLSRDDGRVFRREDAAVRGGRRGRRDGGRVGGRCEVGRCGEDRAGARAAGDDGWDAGGDAAARGAWAYGVGADAEGSAPPRDGEEDQRNWRRGYG